MIIMFLTAVEEGHVKLPDWREKDTDPDLKDFISDTFLFQPRISPAMSRLKSIFRRNRSANSVALDMKIGRTGLRKYKLKDVGKPTSAMANHTEIRYGKELDFFPPSNRLSRSVSL